MVNTQDFLDALDADMAENASTGNMATTLDVSSSGGKYNSVAPIRFSGRHDLFKLPDFLNTIEAQLYARQLTSDTDRICFVGRSLLGPAANWYSIWCRNHLEPRNFNQFILDFKSKFTRMIDPHAVLNSFQKLQERNVGIDNYNAKFTHLLALMPEGIWTPKGELLFYMRGLQPETARIVALMHPADVTSAMEAAAETVSITNRALPTTGFLDFDGDIQMTAAMAPHNPYDMGYDSHPVAAFHHGGGRGHNGRTNNRNGNKPPHRSKHPSRQECFEKNLCFRCYSAKHRFNECPKKNASNP
ncbi:Gag protein of Tms3 LTR-retrotransposon [Monosporozyma servazzii]